MAFPGLISRPLFHAFYHFDRWKDGATAPTIYRHVKQVVESQRFAFDALLDSALQSGLTTPIQYNSTVPKADFLNYLCDWRGFVLHGSPRTDLTTLEPVRLSGDNNEFGNRQQIFCSPDAMWACWFAILDKSKFNLTRNGCVRVGTGTKRIKYYHFELPKETLENKPFTNGMLYICRAEDFPDKRSFPLLDWFNAEIEEWGSVNPVRPLAKMQINPGDFPYLRQVQFSL